MTQKSDFSSGGIHPGLAVHISVQSLTKKGGYYLSEDNVYFVIVLKHYFCYFL